MLLEGSYNVENFLSKGNWETQQNCVGSLKTKSICEKYFSEENVIYKNEFLNRLATKLVTDITYFDEEENTKTTLQKLKKIEYDYINVSESLSVLLNRWLDLRKNIITSLHGAEVKFSLIHRTTASITFMASTLEMVARAGLIFHDLFHHNSIFPFKVLPVFGGIGVASSLMGLSYSKTILENVARDIRDEKRLHIDLETIYRKGNSIDDSVQKLFPHGIDLKLMNDAMHKQGVTNTNRCTLKHLLCAVIISTNFKKDRKIIQDENFLQTLKAFLRSNVAHLWFNRIKMRKLLDEMAGTNKSLEKKELSSGSEAFLSIAAINLYPLFFSLFWSNESFEKVRLIGNIVTSILTARKVAGKEKEFRELRETSLSLMEKYKKIKKMNKHILNDYE